ncbi:MAG: ATP-binding protein [Gemmatimonadota bacterium]
MTPAALYELEAENARLRAVVQTTTDTILILDDACIIRFANPAAVRLFGRKVEDLIGSPFGFPVVVGDTAELDVVRPDGRALIVELRVGQSTWDGVPARIASLRDCTERRKAEQQQRDFIREQAARTEAEAAERSARFLVDVGAKLNETLEASHALRTLAELAVPFLADWVVVDEVDSDGPVRRIAVAPADPARHELASQVHSAPASIPPPNDPTPQLVSNVTSDTACMIGSYFDTIKALQPRSLMVLPLSARGRTIGRITFISSESGRVYQHRDLMLAEELVGRAAIAADNARLYQEAQLANRVKSDFLAVMSHELRTPLNAVIGYSDLLLTGVPRSIPVESQVHVNRIRSSAHHLLRLIEEILTYTRIEAGRERLDLQPVDPHAIVREVAAGVAPMINPDAVRLVCELPDTTTLIRSDPTRLQQILLNLAANAVKFTPAGEVGIRYWQDDSNAHFDVWDTGVGIEETNIERVFEPFWQAQQSHTRTVDGTGLGLTVAKRLTELLGGELRLTSAPKQGTQFHLSLPLGSPDLDR